MTIVGLQVPAMTAADVMRSWRTFNAAARWVEGLASGAFNHALGRAIMASVASIAVIAAVTIAPVAAITSVATVAAADLRRTLDAAARAATAARFGIDH